MRKVLVLLVLLCTGCFGAVSTGVERDTTTTDTTEDVVEDTLVEPEAEPDVDDVVEIPDDCASLVWYQDADMDGYGGSETTYTGCEPPPGYVEVGGDCDDANFDVHPGQYDFFTEPYGVGSFDYNCDGNVELQYPDLHHCSLMDCAVGEGWSTSAVPVCGDRAGWIHCEMWGPVCNYDPSMRTQGCR
jgi:hypothetical protein